jgi:hypothetical protein
MMDPKKERIAKLMIKAKVTIQKQLDGNGKIDPEVVRIWNAGHRALFGDTKSNEPVGDRKTDRAPGVLVEDGEGGFKPLR